METNLRTRTWSWASIWKLHSVLCSHVVLHEWGHRKVTFFPEMQKRNCKQHSVEILSSAGGMLVGCNRMVKSAILEHFEAEGCLFMLGVWSVGLCCTQPLRRRRSYRNLCGSLPFLLSILIFVLCFCFLRIVCASC